MSVSRLGKSEEPARAHSAPAASRAQPTHSPQARARARRTHRMWLGNDDRSTVEAKMKHFWDWLRERRESPWVDSNTGKAYWLDIPIPQDMKAQQVITGAGVSHSYGSMSVSMFLRYL